MARLLFGAENPPGSKYISGSQDHLGLLLPGINRLYYAGEYWPAKIDSNRDADTCRWLESVLHLVALAPRPQDYDPLKVKRLDRRAIEQLGDSGGACYESILNRDVEGLGESLRRSQEAWKKILPETVPEWADRKLKTYAVLPRGHAFRGGRDGYAIIASEKKVPGAFKIRIRNS